MNNQSYWNKRIKDEFGFSNVLEPNVNYQEQYTVIRNLYNGELVDVEGNDPEELIYVIMNMPKFRAQIVRYGIKGLKTKQEVSMGERRFIAKLFNEFEQDENSFARFLISIATPDQYDTVLDFFIKWVPLLYNSDLVSKLYIDITKTIMVNILRKGNIPHGQIIHIMSELYNVGTSYTDPEKLLQLISSIKLFEGYNSAIMQKINK